MNQEQSTALKNAVDKLNSDILYMEEVAALTRIPVANPQVVQGNGEGRSEERQVVPARDKVHARQAQHAAQLLQG